MFTKFCKWIISTVVFLIALLWKVLGIFEAGETFVNMPNSLLKAQDFVLNHQDTLFTIVSWLLLFGSIAVILDLLIPGIIGENFKRLTNEKFNKLSNNNTNERISLLDFYQLTKKYKFRFQDQDCHSIKLLTDSVRQAGIDGKLNFWGRKNINLFEAQNRNEPLIPISSEHWLTYDIDYDLNQIWDHGSRPHMKKNDNFVFKSVNYKLEEQKGNFLDLHLNKLEGIKFVQSINPNDFILQL